MKTGTYLIPSAVALAAGWTLATASLAWRHGDDSSSMHTGPTIEQVQALSCLVTTRVDVADVAETRLDGYTGGAQVAMLVKGDFLLGVDLSRAKFESETAPPGRWCWCCRNRR